MGTEHDDVLRAVIKANGTAGTLRELARVCDEAQDDGVGEWDDSMLDAAADDFQNAAKYLEKGHQ